jgi:plasmid stabilization system protein ParE
MSTARTLVLRRVAQREIDDAADWYERQRVGLGEQFIEEVNRMFGVLLATPELYPVVHGDIRQALLHRFPYAVYYLVEPDRVIVVGVVHTARDPAVWQGRS